MHFLFVYGTLKTGFRNNSVLEGIFVSTAKTFPYYKMYDYGEFPVLKKDKFGVAIKGELWLVRNLDALDRFEGELYHRELIMLDAPCVVAWTYLFTDTVDDLMDCGSNWHKEISHESTY
jgi:gamma-glutamylcyclotransferase (GGCT)/AIG2-like uncharacterized protein YtfP